MMDQTRGQGGKGKKSEESRKQFDFVCKIEMERRVGDRELDELRKVERENGGQFDQEVLRGVRRGELRGDFLLREIGVSLFRSRSEKRQSKPLEERKCPQKRDGGRGDRVSRRPRSVLASKCCLETSRSERPFERTGATEAQLVLCVSKSERSSRGAFWRMRKGEENLKTGHQFSE